MTKVELLREVKAVLAERKAHHERIIQILDRAIELADELLRKAEQGEDITWLELDAINLLSLFAAL